MKPLYQGDVTFNILRTGYSKPTIHGFLRSVIRQYLKLAMKLGMGISISLICLHFNAKYLYGQVDPWPFNSISFITLKRTDMRVLCNVFSCPLSRGLLIYFILFYRDNFQKMNFKFRQIEEQKNHTNCDELFLSIDMYEIFMNGIYVINLTFLAYLWVS